MSRKTTPRRGDGDLDPKQQRALAQLVAGATVTKSAEAARVDRSTVHRWLREDFAFQAALNAAQRDLRREVEGRLLHLAHAALEAVATAIDRGDVRAALGVLKGIGALPGTPPSIGGENPEELAEDAAIEAKQRASDRIVRSLTAF